MTLRVPLPSLRLLVVCCLTLSLSSHSQTLDPFYQQISSKVSYDTILQNLQKLESLGKKEPGTAALTNTADWLIGKYQSYGYTSIVRDTFSYNGKQLYNIIVTKPGTAFPPKFLIVDGHYDTYQGPGINDNGSGVVTILEVARLLSQVPTKLSLRFINFSAEEQGLIGSQHYVDHTVLPSNMNVMLVFNIDEVGGVAGEINNTVTCERDEASPSANNAASYAYTDSLVALTQLYSSLLTQVSYAYGSDYVPFQDAGEVITGFYENNESSYVHSPSDVLARMSPAYVTEIAKASVGAALHFSQAYQLNTGITSEKQEVRAEIFPNPAGTELRWNIPEGLCGYRIIFRDATGKQLKESHYSGDDACYADISSLNDGLFTLQFYFDEGSASPLYKILKVSN